MSAIGDADVERAQVCANSETSEEDLRRTLLHRYHAIVAGPR